MGDLLRKFIPRAPRYVLRPNDRHVVRYAPEAAMGPMAVHTTRLLNISETGMALAIDASAAPHVGERIKVELPIPGGDQIAWWAVVVRTELETDHWWSAKRSVKEQVSVGLRFEDLPKEHRRIIRKGLETRFLEDIKDHRQRQWLYLQYLFIKHFWKIVVWTICTAATVGLLYWLSLPTANYDAKHGSPWGERYQIFK